MSERERECRILGDRLLVERDNRFVGRPRRYRAQRFIEKLGAREEFVGFLILGRPALDERALAGG